MIKMTDLIPDQSLRRRRLHPTCNPPTDVIVIIVTMMLKNTSAKENRGGKEKTRNDNETESEE
jgi:hypothetical protein